MKKIFLIWGLICSLVFPDTMISNLPALAPGAVGVNDVFPMVSISLNQTSKFKLSDILSIPSLQSPTFSGIVTAPTFVGSLQGNALTATSAGSFSGSFLGDVTGTQSSTVVSLVGGSSASNVNAATVLANAATSSNTNSAIVRRDGSGNFSAGTITANLTGNISGTAPAGTLTGATLAANVLSSSLTSVGTLATGTWNATTIGANKGGTGQTSLTANNVILGNGTSGVQFVAPSTSGNVLTSNGTTWQSTALPGAASAVVALYYLSSNVSFANGDAVNFDTQVVDTNSAVTTGTFWHFTAPVTGNYLVSVVCLASTASSLQIQVGVSIQSYFLTCDNAGIKSGSMIVPLSATNTLRLTPDTTATYQGPNGGFRQSQIAISLVH